MLSIEEIEILEDESKWEQAREALMERFDTWPDDEQNLIRLGFLCWYVLAEWGCISVTDDMDQSIYGTILKEITEVGLNNFADNPHFLWCFGYMIFLFPYYFGDFDQWQKLGVDMTKRAYEKTKDPMLKMIYLGNDVTKDLKGYYDACIEAKPLVAERFTGNGVYNNYFIQVLNRKNSSFKEFKKHYSKKKQKLNMLKPIAAKIMKLGNLTHNNP